MTAIHPTAVVDGAARLAGDVRIGPYSVIGPQVTLESGVVVKSHVVIDGCTEIGAGTHIHPFAAVGVTPQDMKFAGEDSKLIIGRNNVIREHVTMNPGTSGGGMVTRVGDNCLLMVGSHVAHDCLISDNVILVNNATLAGHVEIHESAIVGGLSAVHQHVRIGANAMIGGMTGVENDVIPFGLATGNRARLAGLNMVGLKRCGFDREAIQTLRAAYQMLFSGAGTLQSRLEDVALAYADAAEVMHVVDFVRADSSRALCQPAPDRAS